ncbi:hypothetical protein IX51_03090 [uncultured archaeon]|nr:hypothetical protein IX51_03090 [uncultured archaeon]
MRILIAGGTGLIGKRLTETLSKDGNEIVVLTRSENSNSGNIATYVKWSGKQDDMSWVKRTGKIDAVFNLSGRSISDKWNEEVKRAIDNSRIDSTKSIVEGIRNMDDAPEVLINASAIGYYGSRGDEVLTEDSDPGDDFFARLCVNWENEAFKAQDYGLRVIATRTSIVLDSNEGALPQIVAPLRRGIGSRLGSGKQWMSWIHGHDVSRAMSFLLKGSIHGPVNLSAPSPVVNKEFMQTVARAIGKKARLPAPAAILKGMLGEMADYLLLTSQRVSSKKLQDSGFSFEYPELETALKSILSQ